MAIWSLLIMRLIVFALVCLNTSSLQAQTPPKFPQDAKFKLVDQVVEKIRAQIEATAGVLAISKDGELIHTLALGTRDQFKKKPTEPDTLFRIASVTKPITHAAIRNLVKDEKITFETKVFPYLKIVPPKVVTPDSDLDLITIQMLVNHQGGWDRDKSFDPMFRLTEVQEFLKLKRTPQQTDIIKYMLNQPLQFKPGTNKVYSNFGYCLLGRVIEKASGKSYIEYLQSQILGPFKIKDIKLARNELKNRDPREAWYPSKDLNVEVMDSHGGLIASAPGLCQWMDRYWIDGKLANPGEWGDWSFMGSLPGTTSLIRQRNEGYNIAVIYNGRRNASFAEDDADLMRQINAAFDALK
jgi:CubicO group peptidase (beta-lactamase class C family)